MAFIDPVVWLTALLTAWTAVLPSVTALALKVILTLHDKHKVICELLVHDRHYRQCRNVHKD